MSNRRIGLIHAILATVIWRSLYIQSVCWILSHGISMTHYRRFCQGHLGLHLRLKWMSLGSKGCFVYHFFGYLIVDLFNTLSLPKYRWRIDLSIGNPHRNTVWLNPSGCQGITGKNYQNLIYQSEFTLLLISFDEPCQSSLILLSFV